MLPRTDGCCSAKQKGVCRRSPEFGQQCDWCNSFAKISCSATHPRQKCDANYDRNREADQRRNCGKRCDRAGAAFYQHQGTMMSGAVQPCMGEKPPRVSPGFARDDSAVASSARLPWRQARPHGFRQPRLRLRSTTKLPIAPTAIRTHVPRNTARMPICPPT